MNEESEESEEESEEEESEDELEVAIKAKSGAVDYFETATNSKVKKNQVMPAKRSRFLVQNFEKYRNHDFEKLQADIDFWKQQVHNQEQELQLGKNKKMLEESFKMAKKEAKAI